MEIDRFEGEFRFLSNFHEGNPIWFNGRTWKTVEHAYQAMKTTDKDEQDEIHACATPGKAKRLGRKVTLRKGWEDMKIDVMEVLVNEKFIQWPELRDKLLATGNSKLIEGNNWNDRFWGVCRGKGKNHLGRILMKTRNRLR